jgi:aryl-phospho-beta-D-glucosidase BglC (GH1 family)
MAQEPAWGGAGRERLPVISKRRVGLIAGIVCVEVLAALFAYWQVSDGSSRPATGAPQLHVSGNQLVDAGGQAVVLRGVDRSGGEYSCVHDTGIWDGPMNQASITAMKVWDVNAVRVPLNEACWNGQSYVPARYRGLKYRQAVQAYVRLLNRNGIVAILDLHWTDGAYQKATCTSAEALCQKPMPDAAQAIPFWSSVARTFKGNDAVLFDVFNEPYPDGGSQAENWDCWLQGGAACAGISYPVAGMQTLVDTIRAAGSDNVILVGGILFANNLSQWLQHEPADPDHNLAASWHSYNFNECVTVTCWDQQIAPIAAKVPVVATEIGENNCADSYINPLMIWLDSRSIGYLAWAWNADFPCKSGPGLITGYNGRPTPYGSGYQSHLKSLK